MRKTIVVLATAVALGAATMATGAVAAPHGHGAHFARGGGWHGGGWGPGVGAGVGLGIGLGLGGLYAYGGAPYGYCGYGDPYYYNNGYCGPGYGPGYYGW
jgi:hypothetical protein